MISLSNYLVLSTTLFVIGLGGLVLNRKNLITMLMSIELILLGVNTNFITFANFLQNNVGELFVFFILTVAAAEAAIGLAIVIAVYRHNKTIAIDSLDELKG